ncbi:PriCT-2 domain-containing protein [Variovorax sp. J22R115]|uniref:PriCT-2 domain-containing protein n=1 Tax=Variovorax sp. J22R115 TaxID=3053509 RepID=UPI0025787482|nr:PriCT-2 domain-containing protein [Variovorax sp. J22R115]MDM0052019.1 PriCT-2 domain-containing protein [Variovorax sp. J22R115]
MTAAISTASPFALSIGANLYDVRPRRREAQTFEDLVALLNDTRATAKGGTYFCGALEGRRGKLSALPQRWLALDIDGASTADLQEIGKQLDAISSARWHTHSHKSGSPHDRDHRLRAVMELDRACSRDELRRVGEALAARLRAKCPSLVIDKSVFQPEQTICAAPPLEPIVRGRERVLPVDLLLREVPPRPAPTERPPRAPVGDAKVREALAALATLHPDHLPIGYLNANHRYGALAVLMFASSDAGISVDQFDEWCAKGADYPGGDEILKRWRSMDPGGATTAGTLFAAADHEAPGWRRAYWDSLSLAERDAVRGRPSPNPNGPSSEQSTFFGYDDFYSYMESPLFLFRPTRALWPAAKVNAALPPKMIGSKEMAASAWLSQHRPIHQLTWHPAQPELLVDVAIDQAGVIPRPGLKAFNLYRAPPSNSGHAARAGPWREHLRLLYPDEAEHIEFWLAHRIQRPGEKCNHAIVMGGVPGIGKDTLLFPAREGVGAWNWHDISPAQMVRPFTGWMKGVVVRVSEARDMGTEVDRYSFYEHSKTIIAAPPETLRVNEKNLKEYYVVNVIGVVFTTNNKLSGLYLPAEDRRHYVAWSNVEKTPEVIERAQRLHPWYAAGGTDHVVAFLRELDLSGFDAKAPPPQTPAFWAMVQAGEAPDKGELSEVIAHIGGPVAVTLQQVITGARSLNLHELAEELGDRKARRSISHKFHESGYAVAHNPDATDGLFVLSGRRVRVYALAKLPVSDQIRAARGLIV